MNDLRHWWPDDDTMEFYEEDDPIEAFIRVDTNSLVTIER